VFLRIGNKFIRIPAGLAWLPDNWFTKTYYVSTSGNDASTGTSVNTAWKTLAKVSATTFNPGDQILLKSGDAWNEQLVIPSAGSNSKNIVLSSYSTGTKPIITSTTTSNILLNAANRGYWTISNIDFRSTGITFGDMTCNIVSDYWIVDDQGPMPGWIIQDCSFNASIYIPGPNLTVKNNTFTGNPSMLDGPAIIVRGPDASGALIEYNTISNYHGRGVWIYRNAHYPTIRYNTIHDIHTMIDEDGRGVNLDGYGTAINNGKVYNNTIYNCEWIGIECENTYNAEIYNNLIYDCCVGGFDVVFYDNNRPIPANSIFHHNIISNIPTGIYMFNSNYWTFANNVIYHSGTGQRGFYQVFNASQNTHDITFVNNIVGGKWLHPIMTDMPPANMWARFDYNDIEPSGTQIYWNDGSQTAYNLAQTQALGFMTHGFTNDPHFVNASTYDFRLYSDSSCIRTGLDIGLTQDISGNIITGTPDIGAYQLVSSEPSLLTALVSYYKLDETNGSLIDSIGNQNASTNGGNVVGLINNSVDISSGKSIKIPYNSKTIINWNKFSISFWVNLRKLPTDISQTMYFFVGEVTSSPWFNIYIRSIPDVGPWQNKINIGIYDTSANLSYSVSDVSLRINTWSHFTFVCGDGSISKIYINGTDHTWLTESHGFVGNILQSNSNSYYMNIETDTTHYVDGKIDEIGIWKRALSINDVSILYNSGNGLSHPFNYSDSINIYADDTSIFADDTTITADYLGNITLDESFNINDTVVTIDNY